MNLRNSKYSLNFPASNSLKNEGNLQEPLTNIILQNDICDQQAEAVADSLRRSFSDSELFHSIKSIKKYKRSLSVQEQSRKLSNLLKPQHGHSKTSQLNSNNKVTVLHAGPELRQTQSKSLKVSGETNCNKQILDVQIFFDSSFEASQQVGQSANYTFGRHNNLQDRYKNRPIFLHYEENRTQLKLPAKLSRIPRHHNSPATKNDPTVSESNEVTNNVNSNLRNDNPQDHNKYNAIPFNQVIDLSIITNTFNEMHISNINRGIIMVDCDKINCSSSRISQIISQIRNSNVKTNKTCSTAMIRFLSQHVSKTNPPFDRPSTANIRIRKRTNEIRERYFTNAISRTNTTSTSNMPEKMFRSKKTRKSSKTINEKDQVKRKTS